MEELDQIVAAAISDSVRQAVLADAAFIADSIAIEITKKPQRPRDFLPAIWRFTMYTHAGYENEPRESSIPKKYEALQLSIS
jgi:hypothetical protein